MVASICMPAGKTEALFATLTVEMIIMKATMEGINMNVKPVWLPCSTDKIFLAFVEFTASCFPNLI